MRLLVDVNMNATSAEADVVVDNIMDSLGDRVITVSVVDYSNSGQFYEEEDWTSPEMFKMLHNSICEFTDIDSEVQNYSLTDIASVLSGF